MNARHAAPLLLALTLVAAPAAAATVPDILPRGHRGIRHRIDVDFGFFADKVLRRHVVAPGETLSGIAKELLGSAARWEEIRALNPKVDPEALAVGTKLLIPSVHAAKERGARAAEWQLYWWADGPMGGKPVPLHPGETPRSPNYHGCLVAVPYDQRAAFEATYAGKKPVKVAEVSAPGSVASKPIHRIRSVPLSTRGLEIQSTWRISGIEDGALVLALATEKHVDAEGKVVKGGLLGDASLLLALAAIGVVGTALLLARRRGRRDVAAP